MRHKKAGLRGSDADGATSFPSLYSSIGLPKLLNSKNHRIIMIKKKPTPHQERVYVLVRKIPKGKVCSYKSIAEKLKTSPRCVGQALKKNPYAPIVPCHRVVSKDGSIGGFKGKTCGQSISEKILLLKQEGITFENGKIKKKYFL